MSQYIIFFTNTVSIYHRNTAPQSAFSFLTKSTNRPRDVLFLIIGAAIVAALIYYYLVRYYSFWTRKGVEQGKTVLIFGDNWHTMVRGKGFPDLIQYVYRKCPSTRYSGMYSYHVPVLVVKDPELLKQILVKDFDHFTDHITFIDPKVDPLWSKNLFARRGQEWREMRTILSPSFTSSKMRTMFVLMEECAENFVQFFLKKDEEVVPLEMKDVYTRFANDVIASTAFGLKVDSLAEPNNEFYLKGKEATSITSSGKTIQFVLLALFPVLAKFISLKIFSDNVGKFFRNVVDETIKTREEKGIVRPDMVQLLMQARKGNEKQEENDIVDTAFATAHESTIVKEKNPTKLTNEDITAQALVFFFAGFDSVASLMCFVSYELAVNQEIQDRLRKEVQATLEECGGKLTYESLLKMKYMDMVISETLRKWPNNVALDRTVTKSYTIPPVNPNEKPVPLDVGTLLWIPTFAIHRDPEYYPDPERFNPERFDDENKGHINPYTYMPFGIGPRNCIGSRFALLEVKTVLFHTLLHFEIVPVEKTVVPLKLKKTFQLNSEGGLWLGLKRMRNNTKTKAKHC